jgi:hypothetical protein
MSIAKALSLIVTLALLAALLSVPCMADPWDKATKVTFNNPVETPSGTLPPGTYWFTVLPSQSNENLVQIWNADRTKLYGTFLTVPDAQLQQTSDKPTIEFEKSAPDSPRALKAWFYPGEGYARMFVYPKQRATELAKRNNQPVLSMPDETASNMTKPARSAQDAPAAALEIVVVKAVTPSGEEVDKSQAIQSPR